MRLWCAREEGGGATDLMTPFIPKQGDVFRSK